MARPLQAAFSCLLLLATIRSAQAQPGPITLSFTTPSSDEPVDSTFPIQVYCASQTSYAITSVVATLQGRSTILNSSAQWYYSGAVSLAGLPKDSAYTLTVEAKDAGGDSLIICEPVIYDPPPVVTLIKPVWGAVGRPTLDVKATCTTSGGHCQIAITIINGTTAIPAGTFTDSAATTVDVSAYEGSWNLQLQVTGTDQFSVSSQQGVDFYVETSPFLTPLYSADNPIIGLLGNNVLVDNLLTTGSPHIVDYTTGAVTAVPFAGQIPYTNGASISSTGMVFLGQKNNQAGAPAGPQILFDWNNGNLDSLFPDYGAVPFKVNGGYLTWNSGQSIQLRNLATQTTQEIGTGTWNDLSASGAIAYTDAGILTDSVLLYQNGQSTLIHSLYQTSNQLFNPLTDGTNVVYSELDNNGNKTTYRYDAKSGADTLLASLGNGTQNPELSTVPFYRVSNGFTAYIKLDSNSIYQAWIRDTMGNNRQVSFFSQSAYLELMAPNGQLSFWNNNNVYGVRYIYDKANGSTAVSSNNTAIPYYQNGGWYLVVGNTLFRVNLQITPDKADTFAVNTKEDSTDAFSLNDFASHYQTSGSLISVVISKIPTHGSLKLGGVGVTVNQVIPRASLATLVYTPALNFVGSDSVVWTGSNGFTASPPNALLVLNVDSVLPTLPPAPQIDGLASSYCSQQEELGFNVTNMPFPGTGTTVSATLDGQTIAIPANGSVTMQLPEMSVGPHAVSVIFSNSVGNDTSTVSFQIVQASTPVVTVSASPATLTNTTQQVLLTATDVSGGGAAPLYTFAGDPAFTQVVQAASVGNTMTIPVSSLPLDTNIIYVQMTTSDSCNTTPVGIDSVLVINPKGTGASQPGDSTGTAGPIVAGPNPFTGQLTVRGLDPAKSYDISLVNQIGQTVLSQAVQGQTQLVLLTGSLPYGIYFMRVYNAQGYLVASSQEILKLIW